MTSLPPSPSPGRPSASRGSRIIRVLRSRYFQCGFFCGAVAFLEGIGRVRVPAFAEVMTTQGVVVIVLAVRSFWQNRNHQGRSGVPVTRAGSRDAMPPVNGFIAGAAWRVMRVAARFMPRAAGSRWLAEAASFLSETPPARRRRALRNYLAAAPQTILVSWAGHLARRTRAR